MSFKKPSALIFAIILFLFVGCSAEPPENLGVHDLSQYSLEGQRGLLPCPDSPNCVVSYKFEGGDDHYLPPIEIHGDPKDAHINIARIIQTSPRAKIVEQRGNYIRAEFTSLVFRFVDDVEFYVPRDQKDKIHFRSASRMGRSDFGVNRKRIEKIRFRYHQRDY